MNLTIHHILQKRHRRGIGIVVFCFSILGALPAMASNNGIEALVKEAFADNPIMIHIAKCESGFRQFDATGSVLRGGAGRGYIGIFQFGETIHKQKALQLGFDIQTTEGNIGYAKHLFSVSGAIPWRECIPAGQQGVSVQPTPSQTGLTLTMGQGARHAQVRILQQRLNTLGFTVSQTGAGSPGNETDYLGALTLDAIRRFQCAQGIVCAGTPQTTGYGRLGPKTLSALNTMKNP